MDENPEDPLRETRTSTARNANVGKNGAACAPTCPSPEINCNGVCVNPTNDPNNCGGCGVTAGDNTKVCAAGATCGSSTCSCASPDSECGTGAPTVANTSAVCTNLKTDPTNCGVCGTICTTSGEILRHQHPGRPGL